MTTSVLVVRHGYIVFEKYYIGDQATQRTIWSATKSVISSLIGIAMQEGLLGNVNQHIIANSLPEFSGTQMNSEISQVTMHHLLTMSSGLAMEHDEDFSKNVFQRALRNTPGKEFFYTDSLGPDILSMILTKTSGLKGD